MTTNYGIYFFSFMVALTFFCPANSPLAAGLAAFWLVFGGFLAFCLACLILAEAKEES